jgi:hypothetical protein
MLDRDHIYLVVGRVISTDSTRPTIMKYELSRTELVVSAGHLIGGLAEWRKGTSLRATSWSSLD